MFEKILGLFGQSSPAPLPEPDEKLALGALMVRLAKADRTYLFEEVAQIDRLLSVQNDLGPLEATKMRATCEALERQMPPTPELVAMLRQTTSEAAREAVALALWRVSLADKVTQAEEAALMEVVEDALGIGPDRSAALRHKARLAEGI